MSGFEVGETAVQVDHRGGFGQARVGDGDCFGDGGMFGGRCLEPGGVVGGQAADAGKVDAEASHGVGHVHIGDRGVDGFVQTAHQGVVLVPGGIVVAQQRGSQQQFCVQFREHSGFAALRGEGSGPYLQGFAQFEQFVDAVQRDIGDDDAAAARRRRQTFRGESPQRFPDGSARDPKAFGLLDLSEDGAGAEAPLENVFPEGPVSPITGAHDLSVYIEDELRQQ